MEHSKKSSEGARKAQLQYQQELFGKAKEGRTVLARPTGEKAYYDITRQPNVLPSPTRIGGNSCTKVLTKYDLVF